jgi:uncharacterized protein
MQDDPQRIAELFHLSPHPTCGIVGEPYRSGLQIPAADLPSPFGGPRLLGNVLNFLVTPEAKVHLHRIRSDQMYHFYLGDPLEVLLLHGDGQFEVRTLGHDLDAGMRPQLFLPAGTFHTARVRPGGRFSFLATSVWLRAEAADVEMGDAASLAIAYPDARELIESFTE